MCSRRFSLGLALSLLLCSASLLWSQPFYDGPDLPEGWYPIHESELTQIENESTALKAESAILRIESANLRTALTTLQTESSAELTALRASLSGYVRDAESLTLQRNVAISAVVVLALALTAAIIW